MENSVEAYEGTNVLHVLLKRVRTEEGLARVKIASWK